MDKKCPQCGTTDIIKARLAYEANTSVTNSTTTGIGIGGGGLGGGVASTKGTSQNLLAQRVAPPKGGSDALLGVLVLAGILTGVCAWIGTPMWLWLALLVAMFIALIPTIKELLGYARDEERKYDRSWLCQRCGWVGEP